MSILVFIGLHGIKFVGRLMKVVWEARVFWIWCMLSLISYGLLLGLTIVSGLNLCILSICKDTHHLYCSFKVVDSMVWKRLCKISWEAKKFVQWGLGNGDISF